MIQICESFAQEFDLLFNAKKTVCILFSGRTRHSGDPPPLYMNNVVLKWTKSAKHLGSIVTYDLKENEEINHKRNDFIGRANSVISNFKHVDKNVSSGVFMSQCCHLFGSQAWLLDSHRGGGGGGGGGGYSVRFRIGMLSTARRLETLQGSKRGVETINFV